MVEVLAAAMEGGGEEEEEEDVMGRWKKKPWLLYHVNVAQKAALYRAVCLVYIGEGIHQEVTIRRQIIRERIPTDQRTQSPWLI